MGGKKAEETIAVGSFPFGWPSGQPARSPRAPSQRGEGAFFLPDMGVRGYFLQRETRCGRMGSNSPLLEVKRCPVLFQAWTPI
jgi:hypothetical protein